MGQVIQAAQIPYLSGNKLISPSKDRLETARKVRKQKAYIRLADLLADGLAGQQPDMYSYGKLMGEIAGRGDDLLGYMTGSQTIAALGLSICL